MAVARGFGAAVGADGTVAGLRQLLPAPQLAAPARRRSMDQRVRAGARRQELSGARIARRRWRAARVFRAFASNDIRFRAPGAGTYYVSVRAVDDLGLHGQDAVATFEGMSQLSTAFGLGVATGTGGFVTLTDY